MRKETEQRVLRFMREKEMLTAGDMVIAGVSGGCDSVVMLRVLLKLQPLLILQSMQWMVKIQILPFLFHLMTVHMLKLMLIS